MFSGATPKAGGALSKNVALELAGTERASGPAITSGQQDKEDPHPPHAADGYDPPFRRSRQLVGRGSQSYHAHPPHPLVKSRIFPAPA